MPTVAKSLEQARELIETRYAESLSVAVLADSVRLSEAHFLRQFQRAFGGTPHQCLIARRTDRAAALLRSSEMPVAEVCRAVGWRSVGSFTSRFTRTFGIPPAAYREAHSGSGSPDTPGSRSARR